jgi:hypothetical protein
VCADLPAGRWKATPVAVKIIEHYSNTDGVGSSRGNRVSAGREMLFATSISHPNLVRLQSDWLAEIQAVFGGGWQRVGLGMSPLDIMSPSQFDKMVCCINICWVSC